MSRNEREKMVRRVVKGIWRTLMGLANRLGRLYPDDLIVD